MKYFYCETYIGEMFIKSKYSADQVKQKVQKYWKHEVSNFTEIMNPPNDKVCLSVDHVEI